MKSPAEAGLSRAFLRNTRHAFLVHFHEGHGPLGLERFPAVSEQPIHLLVIVITERNGLNAKPHLCCKLLYVNEFHW